MIPHPSSYASGRVFPLFPGFVLLILHVMHVKYRKGWRYHDNMVPARGQHNKMETSMKGSSKGQYWVFIQVRIRVYVPYTGRQRSGVINDGLSAWGSVHLMIYGVHTSIRRDRECEYYEPFRKGIYIHLNWFYQLVTILRPYRVLR